jgi:hypothetical protein
MPELIRSGDGRGDTGTLSEIFRIKPGTEELEIEQNQPPRVGWGIKVGSPFAGTYSKQDWWATTLVTEILEETEKYIKFKTKNSEYVYKY